MPKATKFSLLSAVLAVVSVAFWAGSAAAMDCPVGDLDGGCNVNLEDLLLFTDQWLESREPIIEAEDYTSKTDGSGAAAGSAWVELTGDGSSGDGYMRALPDAGLSIDTNIETESPHLAYEIDFADTGTYYLWLKGWSEDPFSQYVHYGLDGSAVSSGVSDSAKLSHDDAFTWQSQRGDGGRPSITVDSTGPHTLDIWMCEDGAKIDSLLVTGDPDYFPEDSGIPADLDGSYRVDMADFAMLAENWLVEVVHECEDWQTLHPEWIFCDDFETEQNLSVNYHDISENGMFVSTNDAFGGSYSLEQYYTPGQVNAGWIIRYIGDNPFLPPGGEKYDEIYVRWYHKLEEGFSELPPKMARIRLQTPDDWRGYVTVHQWIAGNKHLCADTHVHAEDRWEPIAYSTLDYSDPANIGRWICIEVRIKLNTLGQSDGEVQYWADGEQILYRANYNLRSNYDERGLNFVMLDCYWNSGSPAAQSRFYDNLVISTEPIGTRPW